MADSDTFIDVLNSLKTSMTKLKMKVENLQSQRSIPSASKTGAIASNFSSFEVDEDEGPVFTIDQAWTRTFHGVSDRSALMERGKYGVVMIYNYLKHFRSMPEMKSELAWLEIKVNQLVELVDQRLTNPGLSTSTFYETRSSTSKNPTLATAAASNPKPAVLSSVAPSGTPISSALRKRQRDPVDDESGDEYHLPTEDDVTLLSDGSRAGDSDADDELCDDEIVIGTAPTQPKSSAPMKKPKVPHAKPAPSARSAFSKGLKSASKLSSKAKQPATNSQDKTDELEGDEQSEKPRRPAKKKIKPTVIQESDSDGKEILSGAEIEEVVGTTKRDTKRCWSLYHFTPSVAVKKGGPVWKWVCNWCCSQRTSTRTQGCKLFSEETEKLQHPDGSNFINHTANCRKLPPQHQYFSEWTPTNLIHPKHRETANGNQQAVVPRQSASKAIMHGFVTKGMQNPAKEFSKREFRILLIKAIIRDDQPFTYTEGPGVQALLSYCTPASVRLPSHQTVKRNVERLSDAMSNRLSVIMKANTSKISIASDSWTSKNSVFAYLGTVAFWITDNWVLREHVIELIPLNGDHTGASSGKLIFQALIERGISRKMSSMTSVS